MWNVFPRFAQHFLQVADDEGEHLSAFLSRNSYIKGKYDDGSSFAQLDAHLSSLPGGDDANRIFYLALPPTVYHHVTTNIQAHCMTSRLVSDICSLMDVEMLQEQWLT